MGKASGKAEFRTIAAQLEMGIRRNIYSDRLPNIQSLMAHFDVSKQTMTRALGLLQKSGVLQFKGRSGMMIDRTKLKVKKIALVAAWTDGRKNDLLSDITPFLKDLDTMGFQVELIRGDNQQHNFFPEHVLTGFDGVILRSRVRHESALKKLSAAKIPFVSADSIPWEPEIDSTEYDSLSAITQIASDLKNRGFTRIALLYSSGIPGANDRISTFWRKIKKSLALPLLSCDRVHFMAGWEWEKNAILLFEHIQKMKERPEILIHYGGKFDQRIKSYLQNTPEYPFGMKVLYQESLWEHCSIAPEDILIKSPVRRTLLTEAFSILLERFLDPLAPPVHRKITFPVEYLQFPSCPDKTS